MDCKSSLPAAYSAMSSSRENSSSSMICPSFPSHGSVFTIEGVPSRGKLPFPPRPASLTNSLEKQIEYTQCLCSFQKCIPDKAETEDLHNMLELKCTF